MYQEVINTMLTRIFNVVTQQRSYVGTPIFVAMILGLVINMTAVVVSEFIPANGSEAHVGEHSYLAERRAKQKEDRRNKIDILVKEINQSEKRRAILNEIFSDPSKPGFSRANLAAIHQIDNEIEKMNKQKDTLALYDGDRKTDYGSLALMVFASLLINLAFLYTVHIILRDAGKTILVKDKKIEKTGTIFIYIFIVFLIVHLFRDFLTSIHPTEKTWYGWGSYYISFATWLINHVAFMGGLLVGTYAFSIGYCLTGKHYQPKFDIRSPGISFGIGKYIWFLHKWTIIASIVTFIPIVILLRVFIHISSGGMTDIYLFEFAGIVILGLTIIWRITRRALSIKEIYLTQLDNIKKSWKKIEEMKIAPDPTINFLGERWWSLPAAMTGTFAIFWALFKFTGLDALLIDFLK
jgi:hypothetical protein